MTRKHVAQVAREHFNWLPESEFKEQKRPERSHAEVLAELKRRIDDACGVLDELDVTADEAYEAWGNPADWPGYLGAYEFLKDLYENAVP